ncbi:DUF4190 domain-containing protein [Thermoflexus sp.]|uniref:DUF4190 domain-containing protein n=1 Tax=Thermoflexus sp. TaxID=1969742 RepID=UPI002ADDA710|nr:DUF4190 domain-containing protein [Thermoflexus sp.]
MTEAPSPAPTARTNGKAIASLVLSLLGLVGVLPIIGPIIGIILGNQAKAEIAQSGGAFTGEGLAQAGVILGWVALGLSALGVICAVLAFGGVLGLGICSALQQSSQLFPQAFVAWR